MDRSLARRILLAALAIGVLADIALDGPAFGLNLPILTAAMLAAAWLLRRPGRAPDPLDAWLPFSALVLAAFVAVRADPFVTFLDIAGAAVFMGASVAAFSGLAVTRRSATVVMATAAWVLEAVVAGAGRALRAGRPAATDGPRHAPAWFGPVRRGLILAVPLVLIFAVLFASADPIFNRGFQDVMHFRIDLGDLPGRVIFVLAIAWLAGGLLTVAPWHPGAGTGVAGCRGPFRVRDPRAVARHDRGAHRPRRDRSHRRPFRRPAAGVPVRRARHAGRRRHEVQRLRAARLLRARRRGRPGRRRPRRPGIRGTRRSRLYLALAIGLVGLTIVVLASAALRLQLYQDAYGWTELRLYVAVSIAAMAVTLAVLAAFLASDRTRWLGHAMVGIGLVSLIALNVLAPAAFVAERNLARVIDPTLVPPDGEASLDADYLGVLPDDAIPALVAALPSLPPQERVRVLGLLYERRFELAREPGLRVAVRLEPRSRTGQGGTRHAPVSG